MQIQIIKEKCVKLIKPMGYICCYQIKTKEVNEGLRKMKPKEAIGSYDMSNMKVHERSEIR